MADWSSPRPLDEQQVRVNVEMLATYHSTHQFQYPGCICPLIYPSAGNNETVLLLASHGEYGGRFVVACANDACGYYGMYKISPSKGCY